MIMGFTILTSGFLSVFINIKGHAQLLWGQDSAAVTKQATLSVPEPNALAEDTHSEVDA
jgi:hypothetical protein